MIAVIFGLRSAENRAEIEPRWYSPSAELVDATVVHEALLGADVVVLGEVHDNPYHHFAQAALIDVLTDAGHRPAIVWEMIDRDMQPAIDSIFAEDRPSPGEFADAVRWSESGWPEWLMYRPIAEAALGAGLPMIAGDLSPTEMQAVMADGIAAALPGATDTWPVASVYDAAARDAQLDALYYGHCELVARDQLQAMLSAQYARDMALAIAVIDAVDRHGKAILITGNGHARKDIGVPHLLAHARPAWQVSAIGMSEGDTPADPIRYDYTATTPAVDRPDPCAELREHFSNDS